MKIAFINSVVDYGSTGKIVRDCANGAKEQGHEVLICYGRNLSQNTTDTFYFGSKIGMLWHYGMSRFLGRHAYHSSLKTRQLIKRLETFNPDVVHLHNLHGYYLNVPMLMAYLKHKPALKIVMTLHDCWWLSGSSAYYSYAGCKVWDKGCAQVNDALQYPINQWGLRQYENLNDKISMLTQLANLHLVTPSQWLYDECQKSYLQAFPTTVIYNGIDLTQFAPAQHQRGALQPIKLLGVANIWEARKGLEDFIQLSKKLDNTYALTLIGLSDQQIATLPQNIHGIARTSNLEELVTHYQNSDLYLNLSYEETLGMTTVEALACGTPAIVYDQTAVPEVVDSKSGVIVKAGNLDRVYNEIISFDFDAHTPQACVQRSQLFEKQIMVKNYLDIYR